MTSKYRHRRTSDPTIAFPNPIEPGEIAVNTANRQIVVGDAAGGAIGSPLPLLAIRFFSDRAIYNVDDMVAHGGIVYRAAVSNGPGAFSAVDWTAGGTQLFVSDTPPPGVLPGSFWWSSDEGVLYLLYDDGTSTQWVIASPQPDISMFVQKAGDSMAGPLLVPAPTAPAHAANKSYVDATVTAGDATAVRYNAQTLTAAQQTQARSNIFAAPFDAMAYNGLQINGSGEVDQIQLGNVITINNALRFNDMWLIATAGAVQALASNYTDSYVLGFSVFNRIYCTVGVPGAVGANDFAQICNRIEGYRIARLMWGTSLAQPITLGFWIRSDVAGTASVYVGNFDGSRVHPVNITIAGGNTWEWKTVTVPGCTDGVWQGTTSHGIQVGFVACSGSAGTGGVSGVWNTGNKMATPANTNFMKAAGNMVSVCGLIVLPGTQAPTAEQSRNAQRSYEQELLLARRYWWCSNQDVPRGATIGMLAGHSGTAQAICFSTWRFTVPMRIIPVLQVWNAGVQNQVRNTNTGAAVSIGGAPSNAYFTKEGGTILVVPSTTAGVWSDFDLIADARL